MEIQSRQTGNKILISENQKVLNQIDAKKELTKLGESWRLPTLVELEQFYKELFLEQSGNFTTGFYWSSENPEGEKDYGLGFGFSGGVQMKNSIYFQGKVRFVKDL